MKCAGAPIKYTVSTDDVLRRRGKQAKAEPNYFAPTCVLFSVPIEYEKVCMLFDDPGVRMFHQHTLAKIDPDQRIATFRTSDGLRRWATTSSTSFPREGARGCAQLAFAVAKRALGG